MSYSHTGTASTIGVHPFSQSVLEQIFPTNECSVRRCITTSFFPVMDILNNAYFENQMIKAINHPDVVPFKTIEKDGNKVSLTRPYMHGSSLAELVYETGPQSREFALSTTLKIANALQVIHSHGVIATNLKAENVIVGPNDSIKLVDLGISAFYLETISNNGSVLSCVFAGPRCCGEGCVKPSKELDIFNLGIILYIMLVGRLPWKVHNMVRIMNQILHNCIPIPQEIDLDLQDLLREMFSCSAKDRPSVERLIIRIEALLLEQPRITHRMREEIKELHSNSVRSSARPEMLFRKDSSYDQLANYKRPAILNYQSSSGQIPAVRSRVLRGIKPKQIPLTASTFFTHQAPTLS